MRWITLIVLIVFSSISQAETNWYRVSANTLLVADWLQTRNTSTHDEYYETNNILGEQPTESEVDKYFAVSILLVNVLGSYILPEDMQDAFYLTVATVEGAQVLHNYRIGVRFEF